jgi:predicted RNA-binding Zn-ribbon protein involved in translation (DUF1610 family)
MLIRLIVGLAICFAAAQIAAARTWTSRDGKSIEATFVRINGTTVILLRGNKPLRVPITDLSDADQEYVREQVIAGRKKPPKRDPSHVSAESPAEPDVKQAAPTEALQPSMETINPTAVRTWTDIQGEQVQGQFVRREGSMVLLTVNGEQRQYPVSGFCDADRQFIERAAAMVAAAAPPPSSPPPSSPHSAPNHYSSLPSHASLPPPQLSRYPMRSENRPPPVLTFEPRQTFAPSPPPEVVQPTPSPIAPQYVEEEVMQCMSCNKIVSSNAKVGDKCPHCGTTWDARVDEKGKVVESTPRYRFRGIAGIVFVVIVILSAIVKLAGR